MTFAVLYAVALVLFLLLDVTGLTYILSPIFREDIGPIMRGDIRFAAALGFYLVFVAGLVFFAAAPGLRENHTLLEIGLKGAFLGLMAYGTYEFTNYATLEMWTPRMVVVDLCWGMALSACVCAGSVAVTRIILPTSA